MKKTLSFILALALVLSCALIAVSAVDEPSAYLWLKKDADGTDYSVTWVFDNSSGILENGKTYTCFATAKFDEGCTGTVYCNCYVYDDVAKAIASDWSGLMNFLDYAKCGSIDGVWNDFEASWVFSDTTYGGFTGEQGTTIGGVTMGIGFYQASGTISVSELGFKDENGEVVWSYTFEYGIDFTANDIIVSDSFDYDGEGDTWGLVGADVVLPEPAEKGEIISVGKSYTVDDNYVVRDDGYGDPGFTKLTDGTKDDAGSAAPAGFNFAEGANSASVTVDLGEETDIAAIVADLQGGNWGIPNPATYSVSFAISTDGESFTSLGTVSGDKVTVVDPAESDSDWGVSNFEYDCVEGTKAKFVKVTFNKPADYTGNHCWPSEIQIYGVASGEEPTSEPAVDPSTPDNPPKTGDNGMIALAVISVIALAGAVVVKKSK